ncbi:MAG: phytanoyl-CoA dioxygenase family protein [Acidobacteriota bacterium]|nr:phytanoyl-CoA dioxygenase family protein [Acidobacteriota bacterium]
MTHTEVSYPAPADTVAFGAYYREQGYVVANDLIPHDLCDALYQAYMADIKHFSGPIMRQATTRPERHNLSRFGHMTNPILNLQDLEEEAFQPFRRAALDIVSHPDMQHAVAVLTEEEPVLVQTMYFESGRGNDPHADSHFSDARKTGSMVGAWVALEDIPKEAGPFFVYPGSHLLGDPARNPDDVVADYHDWESIILGSVNNYQGSGKTSGGLRELRRAYKLMTSMFERRGIQMRVPELKRGDAIFWSSLMVHGSLKPTDASRTRNSLTAHFIPGSQDYLLGRERPQELVLNRHQGLNIHHPARAVDRGA